jgi:kinesin family protein 3/17
MPAEAVKVVVRCRPLFGKELAEKRESIVKVDVDGAQVSIRHPSDESATKSFTFDATYDEDTVQKNFYDESAYPLVESVMEGFNGTIFAYGQVKSKDTVWTDWYHSRLWYNVCL